MNNHLELVAEERIILGKQVRQLRRKGLVPAVLYGHNTKSVPVQVDRGSLEQLVRAAGGSSILRLKVGRKQPVGALLKQVQFHPTSGELLHVDFFRVTAREKVRVPVPLRFVGTAPAAETHDVTIVREMDEIQVECLPGDLPGAVEVDLSRLEEPHSAVRVGDLAAGPKVAILGRPEVVVARVAEKPKEVIRVLETAAEQAREREAGEVPAEAPEEAEEIMERAA